MPHLRVHRDRHDEPVHVQVAQAKAACCRRVDHPAGVGDSLIGVCRHPTEAGRRQHDRAALRGGEVQHVEPIERR